MRLGSSTLMPHALDDTDADTEVPGSSFGGDTLSYDYGGPSLLGAPTPPAPGPLGAGRGAVVSEGN